MKHEYKKWLTAVLAASMLATVGVGSVSADSQSDAFYRTIYGDGNAITRTSTTFQTITQNTASSIFGALNAINSMDENAYTGVANTITGTVNMIQNSNGVVIQGTGNQVSNAYKDMKLDAKKWQELLGVINSSTATAEEKQKAIDEAYKEMQESDSGAVAVIGGANVISGQTYTTVIGFDNTVTGAKENNHDVFLAGSHNALTGVSDSLIMGNGHEGKYKIENKKNVISLGNETTVNGDDSILIGMKTTAGQNGIAEGTNASAGKNAVALGAHSTAGSDKDGHGGVAIGNWANATSQSVAVGQEAVANVINGTAVGRQAKAYGMNSVAIGSNATVGTRSGSKQTNVDNALAIGTSSNVQENNSIAIGAFSIVKKGDTVSTASAAINGTEYAFAGGSANGTVSIGGTNGKVTYYRTLTNLAAGRISATSTDAVNGSQLYATNQALEALNTKVDNLSVTIKGDGNIKVDGGDESTKKFSDGTTGSGSTGGGSGSTAKTEGNVTFDLSLNKEKIDLGNVTIEGTKGSITAKTVNAETVEATTVNAETVNAETFKAGDTAVTNDGIQVGSDAALTKDTLKVDGKTYINGDGINANGQKIQNVAAGELSSASTDAVNGSQLYATNQQVAQNTVNINKLGNRLDRVGAGAAALAALHPLDFDPEAKWDFAAGYGNYRGANAAALGAFYRPNENWMLSLGGSFGGGENMVNAGVSVKLGAGSAQTGTSKAAMAAEIRGLRGTVAAQDEKIAEQGKELAAQKEELEQLRALVESLAAK